MDNLEFSREALRRAMRRAEDALAKAAEHYDPEQIPVMDGPGAMAVAGLLPACQDYLMATAEAGERWGATLIQQGHDGEQSS